MKSRASTTSSLRHRLLFAAVITVVVGGTISGEVARIYEENRAMRAFDEQTERVVRLFSAIAIEAVISEDVPVLRTGAEQLLASEPTLLEIKISNEDARELVSASRDDATAVARKPMTLHGNVEFEGETFGGVTLRWDPSQHWQAVEQRVLAARAFGIGTALMLCLCLYIWTAGLVLRPIEAIHARLRGFLNDGTLRETSTVFRARELAALSDSIDMLAVATTESKLRNEALARAHESERQAKLDALAAAQAKAHFLANVSHELRTPLNGVLGMLQLLDEAELSEQHRDYVRTAHESGQLLLNLIGDVLDYSKSESGHLVLDFTEFDLPALIDNTVRAFDLAGDCGAHVALHVAIDNDVPRYLYTDSTRLHQILNNLIGNAVKFTHQGNITVRVACERHDGDTVTLRCSVADTGIGISEEAQQQVFKPFTQADRSTTREFGGTGLGLSICQQLVARLHGTINVQSEPGKGSVFCFSIEARECSAPAPREGSVDATAASDPAAVPPAQRRPTILVVDDNTVNRRVAGGMLEKFGCNVRYAVNGAQALALWSEEDFDLTLLDCQMPVLDGYEAIATQRRRERQAGQTRATVVGLTANAMVGDKEKCLAAGMDDYLPKPLERSKLGDILEAWVTPAYNAANLQNRTPARA